MQRTVRSKWKLVALFWLAQAALAYVAWPLLMLDSRGNPLRTIKDLPELLLNPVYAASVATAVGSIMILQVAFLRPVRRPRMGGDSLLAKLAHHLAAAVAIGILVGAAAIALSSAALLFEYGRVAEAYVGFLPWSFLIVAGAGFVVALPILI